MSRRDELEAEAQHVVSAFAGVPKHGLGLFLRLQACVIAMIELEARLEDMDANPYPPLLDKLAQIRALPECFAPVIPHLETNAVADPAREGDAHTRELFQTAWTTYNSDTYRHSLELMKQRLARSGFDAGYFSGKRCLDGGCGTGRFSVAMAQAGAAEVIAADFGEESLAALEKRKAEYQVPQIKPLQMDVTDLSQFDTGTFDFVASQGVLHHTMHPDRGIQEHFRITRPGGHFWLYLYGAGGIYWPMYDQLRPLVADIEPKAIRAALGSFGLRQGLIYTFLDNFLAPRVYYSLEQTLALLRPIGAFSFEHMKGASPIDDTGRLLATQWGRELVGPDGEVRIVVTKQ